MRDMWTVLGVIAAAGAACSAWSPTAMEGARWGTSVLEASVDFADPDPDEEGEGDEPLGEADGFPRQNMSLIAWLPLSDFEGNHGAGNDCWGYVSPSGREYAIMGLEKGFGFVEVTDPGNPVIIEVITGPASTWHDVKVVGEWAYGVSEGGAGIQVMDLRQIDSGIVTLVQNALLNGHSTTHNIVANVDTGFVYLVGANIGNGGLVAVDVHTDPANPSIVGQWSQMYIHDAQVVSYTDGPFAGREIAFCLSGFGGGFQQTGLRIVDVTDKSNMFTISSGFWSGAQYSHQGWLSEDNRYFYINDELDEGNTVSVTTTRIFDVSDINSPRFVGTTTSGVASIDHNLYIKGNLMFQANYRSGLRVFDITNPEAPQHVAYFDTYPSDDNASFNGAWSNYPYLPSGIILISDIERGLFIVKLDDINVSYIDAPDVLAPDTTDQVIAQITDALGTVDPQTVRLQVSVDGGAPSASAMSEQSPGVFAGQLPAFDCGDEVAYWVTADSTDGNPSAADTVNPLVGALEVAIDIPFETQPAGWFVANDGFQTASTGTWGRLDPSPTAAQPGDDHTPTGTQCYVTDGRAGTSIGTYDVDAGRTTLVSQAFDTTLLDEPMMSYWRWYSNTQGSAPNQDVFRVDISSNDGVSWVPLEVVGPTGVETTGGWFYHEFRVADFVTPTAAVRLRFIAEDLDPGSIVEAAIDDVRMFRIECEDACAVDLTGEGDVNTNDFFLFLSLYQAGDPQADFAPGGGINTNDFFAFLAAYQAGC